jgi:hypothetical protein
MRDLRLSTQQTKRRRYIKIQKHSPKGAKAIYWCGHCERYTYDLGAHNADGKCKRSTA